MQFLQEVPGSCFPSISEKLPCGESSFSVFSRFMYFQTEGSGLFMTVCAVVSMLQNEFRTDLDVTAPQIRMFVFLSTDQTTISGQNQKLFCGYETPIFQSL